MLIQCVTGSKIQDDILKLPPRLQTMQHSNMDVFCCASQLQKSNAINIPNIYIL